jgi:hypothetical protein
MGVEHGAHVIYDSLLFDPKSDFLCCRLALVCPNRSLQKHDIHAQDEVLYRVRDAMKGVLLLYIAAAYCCCLELLLTGAICHYHVEPTAAYHSYTSLLLRTARS